MGRKNLVRFSRFLANEARFDSTNDMEENGERIVQQAVLCSSTQNPAVLIDVGANLGIWSRAAVGNRRPEQKLAIHAFEPCAETAENLKRNLASWGIADEITVNCVAASSESGVATFYSSGANEGINGLYPDQHRVIQSAREVPKITLTEYCNQRKIGTVDLLKIDAEGHDIEVLLGAAKLLEARCVRVAQFEYNHRWISARRYLKDVFALVQPFGYTVGKITPRGVEFYDAWHYELETFREANYVAVQKELVPQFPQVAWWNQ